MAYNPANQPALPMQPAQAIEGTVCPTNCSSVVKVGTADWSETALRVCFPKDYFRAVQGYLRQIRDQLPPASSPTDQVYWALDVWFHINAALYALNIPFAGVEGVHGVAGGYSSGISDAYQPIRPIAVLKPYYDAIESFYTQAENTRALEASALKTQFANPTYVADAQKAKLYPAPFMSLMAMWGGTIGRNVTYSSPIGDTINASFIPWMAGGNNPPNTSSWRNKSASDQIVAQQNPAFRLALERWHWWSMRDLYPWDKHRAYLDNANLSDYLNHAFVPRGMNRIESMSSLGNYLKSVQSEAGKTSVWFDGVNWYPSINYTCRSGLTKLLDMTVALDFDKTIRDHVSVWLTKSQPELDPTTGEVKTFVVGSEIRKAATPVTPEDYADIRRKQTEAIQKRMDSAIDNPTAACGSNAACLKANQITQKFADNVPIFGQFKKAMEKILRALVSVLGAAEGWSYIPFTIMNNPFMRSVTVEGWSTIVKGSSKDVLKREVVAITAIQETLHIYITPWLPPQWVSTTAVQGQIVLDAEGNPVFKAGATAGPSEADCSRLIDAYLAQNRVSLTAAQRQEAMGLCMGGPSKQLLLLGFLQQATKGQGAPLVIVPPKKLSPVKMAVGGSIAVAVALALLRKSP